LQQGYLTSFLQVSNLKPGSRKIPRWNHRLLPRVSISDEFSDQYMGLLTGPIRPMNDRRNFEASFENNANFRSDPKSHVTFRFGGAAIWSLPVTGAPEFLLNAFLGNTKCSCPDYAWPEAAAGVSGQGHTLRTLEVKDSGAPRSSGHIRES
jgi:hypothetical protein